MIEFVNLVVKGYLPFLLLQGFDFLLSSISFDFLF